MIGRNGSQVVVPHTLRVVQSLKEDLTGAFRCKNGHGNWSTAWLYDASGTWVLLQLPFWDTSVREFYMGGIIWPPTRAMIDPGPFISLQTEMRASKKATLTASMLSDRPMDWILKMDRWRWWWEAAERSPWPMQCIIYGPTTDPGGGLIEHPEPPNRILTNRSG